MDKNYRNPVFRLKVKSSASKALYYHPPKHKRKVKYSELPHNMFSFLSGFCLKYILVTEAKIHPGANIGRGLKVIKFYPEQSRWAADGERFHADPGTWSFIHNVAHPIGARSVRNICLGLGAFTHKLMLKNEKTSVRGEKKDYSIMLSYT